MDGIQDLDLFMYAGKWYEIAKLPNPWQKECHHSITDYYVDDRPMAKGELPKVDIVSTCYGSEDQVVQTAKARGYVPDASHPGVLKTKWEMIPKETWLIVYDTDYVNYALEGDKDKKHLWVLSRSPEMCVNVMEQLVIRANSLGFDVEPLEIVPDSLVLCPLSLSPNTVNELYEKRF